MESIPWTELIFHQNRYCKVDQKSGIPYLKGYLCYMYVVNEIKKQMKGFSAF